MPAQLYVGSSVKLIYKLDNLHKGIHILFQYFSNKVDKTSSKFIRFEVNNTVGDRNFKIFFVNE